MNTRAVLSSAKAFLCWERLEDLSIQLVPVHQDCGYFYPSHCAFDSIVIFYDDGGHQDDAPLFLLFHEAGHALQWHSARTNNCEQRFYTMMQLDRGPDKTAFEKDAWELGRKLLDEFITRCTLSPGLLVLYDRYSAESLKSYGEDDAC